MLRISPRPVPHPRKGAVKTTLTFDQAVIVAAAMAARFFIARFANEAGRPDLARPIQPSSSSPAFVRIIVWNVVTAARASTSAGIPSSIVAIVRVSAFDSASREF